MTSVPNFVGGEGRSWPDLAGRLVPGGHVLAVRVYYEDTDFSGFVYHANFLRYMERGRSDYLRLLGVEQGSLFEEAVAEVGAGFAFVVRHMDLDFRRPAKIDDILEVHTHPAEVRGASLTLAQTVRRGEEILIAARIKVAFVAGERATRIPLGLRKAMGADVDATTVDATPAG
ncbi:tol-pal system-associated acyl-CoA thioesterase [Blastochloris tepida]|uniref:Tol-pal system-associated acyl-CoA thioesterase n=1 Tax=Blastochloris tepida TaxID=2233851 RepID=A0A348FWV0_9HYPH|nr:tol-pal system-associated acyl-CoA thioesterase [Blastochloris tepida]